MSLRIAIAAAWFCLSASAEACRLSVPTQPFEYKAVVDMSPAEETERQTKIAEMKTGGAVTPRYIPLPRILAHFRDKAGFSHRIIPAVTDGAIPAPGSAVVLRSRYLDPDNDRQFIPWTVKPAAPTS